MLRYDLSATRQGIKPNELGKTSFDGIAIEVRQDQNGVYGVAGGETADISIENKGHEIHKNVPVICAGMWGMFGGLQKGDKVRVIALSSLDGGEGSRSLNGSRLVALGATFGPGEMARQLMAPFVGAANMLTDSVAAMGAAISKTGPSDGELGRKVAETALRQVGKPYIRTTEGPDTFDCSGLVWWSHQQCGVKFKRVLARNFPSMGIAVTRDTLLPGDVIVFQSNKSKPPEHCAIYIGDGNIVHAKGRKWGVVQEKLRRTDIAAYRRLW